MEAARRWCLFSLTLAISGCITPWDEAAAERALAGTPSGDIEHDGFAADAPTHTGSPALRRWLQEEDLGFGFAVAPDGYERSPIDCTLDPALFGDDPHATLLDRGFFVGLGGRSSDGFRSFWDETFAPDWGVDGSSAVGGKILAPDDELVTDVGWVANKTDETGRVRDEWMSPQDFVQDQQLATAWYHMEFAGIFRLDASNARTGFIPEAMFLFADFAMVEGEIRDAVFSSSTAPAAFHILLYDGSSYCDVAYELDASAFGYASE